MFLHVCFSPLQHWGIIPLSSKLRMYAFQMIIVHIFICLYSCDTDQSVKILIYNCFNVTTFEFNWIFYSLTVEYKHKHIVLMMSLH